MVRDDSRKSKVADSPWWMKKSLAQMSRTEWESLCDGCGKCCLVKLEDADDGEILFTDVACHLLDGESCRCRDYANRRERVPDCVYLDASNISSLNFMPATCAYRLLAEGRELPDWHPLVTGDPESVHRAGISVRGRIQSEKDVRDEDLEDHVVSWPA